MPSADTLATGVLHRAIATGPEAGIDLIDVDFARASVKIAVVTDGTRSAHGRTFGLAYTPAQWQQKTHALAAVNGGFFGQSDDVGRTEIMGLLVQNGKVRHSATVPHAALLLDKQGHPQIVWASVRQRIVALSTSAKKGSGVISPGIGPGKQVITSAVGCGPMLVWNGKVCVTDREERLVSPEERPRTFVATDRNEKHFVMGIASVAEYRNLARFLAAYFPDFDGTRAGCAFCLDGGSSSQLTYKLRDGTVLSPRMTGAAVPDAIVIVSR